MWGGSDTHNTTVHLKRRVRELFVLPILRTYSPQNRIALSSVADNRRDRHCLRGCVRAMKCAPSPFIECACLGLFVPPSGARTIYPKLVAIGRNGELQCSPSVSSTCDGRIQYCAAGNSAYSIMTTPPANHEGRIGHHLQGVFRLQKPQPAGRRTPRFQ